VTKELTRLRQQIEELCSQNVHGNHEEIQRLCRHMDEVLYREEIMWLQRSRVDWLREGDRNTKFFHRRVVGRAKKNAIKVLRNRNHEITKDRREMEGLARDYFIDLHEADSGVDPQGIMHLFQPTVSQDMNDNMCKAFTDEEIGDALFQMGPLKALGPDGFPARFFQKNWEFMKADVIKGVRHFFQTRVMPEDANDMDIVLIPKNEQAELLKDYQSISLCGLYCRILLRPCRVRPS
jgi:hypothetical protein